MRKNTRIFFIVIELCLHYCVNKNIQILYRQLDFFDVSDKESDINYGCLTHNIINSGKNLSHKTTTSLSFCQGFIQRKLSF